MTLAIDIFPRTQKIEKNEFVWYRNLSKNIRTKIGCLRSTKQTLKLSLYKLPKCRFELGE